jgi:hypothetical protein
MKVSKMVVEDAKPIAEKRAFDWIKMGLSLLLAVGLCIVGAMLVYRDLTDGKPSTSTRRSNHMFMMPILMLVIIVWIIYQMIVQLISPQYLVRKGGGNVYIWGVFGWTALPIDEIENAEILVTTRKKQSILSTYLSTSGKLLIRTKQGKQFILRNIANEQKVLDEILNR